MNCAIQPAAQTRRTIVSVNGKVISHAAISQETQNHPSATPVEAWVAAARALALRELLRQEVDRLAIVAEPQTDADGRVETAEEAAMRALLDSEAPTPEAREDECRRYYDNNLARFRSTSLSEAAHILIPAEAGEVAARAQAGARAQVVADHLAEHPEDFAEMAREFSACPSARQGGDLGQLSGGETVPEFEAALARLQPGETTRKPVETRFGFHVIHLARRIEGKQAPFERVHERIRSYLGEAVRRRALAQYVALLAGRANLQGIAFNPPSNMM